MSSDALTGPSLADAGEAAAPAPQRWRDEMWSAVVGAMDGVLRSCYAVTQFTDDADCVLRLGRGQARYPVVLADGTEIAAGDTIGTIHFWNEQLPPFSPAGPDLNWAMVMRRRVVHSFEALARFVETDPDWQAVPAFRGEAALSSRLGETQLLRVAHRLGLELVAEPQSWLRCLHDLGECFSAWGLARAYNPAALPRQRFFRPYHDLWISRSALLRIHGRRGAAARRRIARCAHDPAPCSPL